MKEKDIPQVSMIENDAFPNLFPPTSFRKELQRPISTLMVAISQVNPHQHQGIFNNRTTERGIQVSSYRSGNTGSVDSMVAVRLSGIKYRLFR